MARPDVDKYIVAKPAYEVVPKFETKNRIPPMTLMSGKLVPGSRMYIETGWILGMPDPNPHIDEHSHDYEWKKFEKPHLEMTIMIGASTLAEADPG